MGTLRYFIVAEVGLLIKEFTSARQILYIKIIQGFHQYSAADMQYESENVYSMISRVKLG